MIRSGTGTPQSQPAISSERRVKRLARRPAKRLANALVRPNVAINDTATVADVMPNSVSARAGRIDRSKPTMPPTNALIATSSANCRQFAPRPSVGNEADVRVAAAADGRDITAAPPRHVAP